MRSITRSRLAITMLFASGGLYSIGALLALVAWARFSPSPLVPEILRLEDWYRAADWLVLSAFIGALGGVVVGAWRLLRSPERKSHELVEIVVALLGSVFFAVAALRSAQEWASPLLGGQPATSFVFNAIGFGLWGISAASEAVRGRESGPMDDENASKPVTTPWILVAASLLGAAGTQGVLASKDGVLLFGDAPSSQGMVIAGGAIGALCICGILGALLIAKAAGLLHGRAITAVCIGLVCLAASRLAYAIDGIVLLPQASVDGVRVGMCIVKAFLTMGFAVLAGAAWLRLNEASELPVPLSSGTSPPPPSACADSSTAPRIAGQG